MKKIIMVGIILLLVGQHSVGQQKVDIQMPDSTSNAQNSFLVIPYAFYTPETHWGFGISSGYYFSKEESRRISNIQGVAVYTQENQFKLSVTPKVFSEDKRSFFFRKVGSPELS